MSDPKVPASHPAAPVLKAGPTHDDVPAKPRLMDMVRRELRTRHYSPRTEAP